MNGFGKAFASIGIFLIITAVTELAMAWYDVASGTKKRGLIISMAEIIVTIVIIIKGWRFEKYNS